ncbi:hypothetical protein F5H01DRAFT_292070, partial [Linnemannia elongata]
PFLSFFPLKTEYKASLFTHARALFLFSFSFSFLSSSPPLSPLSPPLHPQSTPHQKELLLFADSLSFLIVDSSSSLITKRHSPFSDQLITQYVLLRSSFPHHEGGCHQGSPPHLCSGHICLNCPQGPDVQL